MSTAENAPKLSFGSKLGINLAITKAIGAALLRLGTSPFKGTKGAPVYFKDVMYSMTRTQLRNLNIEQAQYLNKPTTEAYLEFAKANKIAPVTDDIGNGAKGHWLGDKSAKVVLLYLHGGGYAQPMTPGHLTLLNNLQNLVNASNPSSLSVCILSYTLAPQAEYPTQLTQAAALLAHLLTTKSASDIIVGGDSAGGNLLCGVLSHLLHPHPKIAPVDLKGSALRGALLLSPWVSFDTRHGSYDRNAESDLFDAVPLEMWSRAFLGSTQRQGILMGDSYSEPLVAEPGWWAGAHNVVDEVLIWGGGGEILIDGINAFAEKFKEGWVSGGGSPAKVQVVVRDRLAHEQMVVDLLLGYTTKGPGALDVENFVKSKL